MNHDLAQSGADFSRTGESTLPQPGGRGWALAFAASLFILVCVRFFTDSVGVLPGVAQYVDMPLTAVMLFCILLRLIRSGVRTRHSGLVQVTFLFVLVALISASMNLSRADPLPVGVFIFTFTAPLLFAIVAIGSPMGRQDVLLVTKAFFWLGLLQVFVAAVYSMPRFFATGDPDYVSGTFGINAYQFTYFLGLWLLYVLGGTLNRTGRKSLRQNVMILLSLACVFGLFYAAQYRAMLVFFTLVILVSLWASPVRFSKRVMQMIGVAAVSVGALISVATAYPDLKLLGVFDLFQDATPVVESGKAQAVGKVGEMYGDMPHTMLVGSGPATFTSRAHQTFSKAPQAKKEAAGAFLVSIMGGRYQTDVAREYVGTIDVKPIQGGTTASSPFSSYTSLAAEVGILGLFIYLAAYGIALTYSYRKLRQSAATGDALTARLAFTCFGGLILLLVQALFDNWLDATRVAIPLWILVGLLYALEDAPQPKSEQRILLDA